MQNEIICMASAWLSGYRDQDADGGAGERGIGLVSLAAFFRSQKPSMLPTPARRLGTHTDVGAGKAEGLTCWWRQIM